jgi:hypothetical protein
MDMREIRRLSLEYAKGNFATKKIKKPQAPPPGSDKYDLLSAADFTGATTFNKRKKQ